MPRWSLLTAAVAALMATGCNLSVENPNSPDAPRAFVDPAGLQQLMSGAFRTWAETRGNYYVMPLDAQADNYTASWNNAAMRFYSSVGSDCPSRCGWTNSATAPEAAGGPTVEALWYGYYTVLSGATDVLRGIQNGLCFDNDCTTDSTLTIRNKAIAKMQQGMALAGIAMVYDQGFIVDENTDLSNPSALPFATRAEVRDAALAKFDEAFALAADAPAGVGPWDTPPEWMGVGSGTSYSNTQIRQLIRTMQAELVALFPRNGAENTANDWASVVTYASQGISSGTPFNWQFYIDISGRECGIDCMKTWGNSVATERVDTRVAALLTSNHLDPWPSPGGNPCPTVSTDLRVGDGTFGPSGNANYDQVSIDPATGSAGTDYACAGVVVFPAARGSYHQSNLQHVRYHELAYRGEDLPADDGTGQDPYYTTQMNDLLWAEGVLRSGGSAATAAGLINNSRVTRGGLTALTGGEGTPALIAALQYEQEIEFMGQGVDPFFNRRRSGYTAAAAGGRPPYNDGLIPGTPRHMPVPAKELNVLQRAVYTFGGSGADMSPTTGGGQRRETVADRFRALQNARPGYLTRFLGGGRTF